MLFYLSRGSSYQYCVCCYAIVSVTFLVVVVVFGRWSG